MKIYITHHELSICNGAAIFLTQHTLQHPSQHAPLILAKSISSPYTTRPVLFSKTRKSCNASSKHMHNFKFAPSQRAPSKFYDFHIQFVWGLQNISKMHYSVKIHTCSLF